MRALLDNPALLVGLIRAVLIFATSFGVAITDAQIDNTLVLVGAFLAVLSVALTGVTVSQTTPTANPVLSEGTVVEVVTPEGQANKAVIV